MIVPPLPEPAPVDDTETTAQAIAARIAKAKARAEAPASDVARGIRLTVATDIDPLPVRWLWEDRIPVGEITLTPGLAGVGKSTFHAWVIARITRGELPGVYQGDPRPAIICASEDSWARSIVPRLMAAGADLSRVYRAEMEDDTGHIDNLNLPADVETLAYEVARLDVAVVSVDPLLSAIDGNLDSHKGREIRRALEPLRAIADETRAVVLGNAHFNKSTGMDPLLRITGATAFGEVARAALAFAKDDHTGEYVISQIKNNLGRDDLANLTYRFEPVTIDTAEGPSTVTKIHFTGSTSVSVKDLLSPRSDDEERTSRDVAKDVILDELTAGPAAWKSVVSALKREGISERTGVRARNELKKGNAIELIRHDDGSYEWQLR